jgi:hypothetical protein
VSAFVVACLTLLLTSACGGGHPRLSQGPDASDGWFGMADGYVAAGEYMLFTNEIYLCLDRPGRVEIVDVSFKHTDGEPVVDGIAVRPFGWHHPDVSEHDRTIWDVGFTKGDVWVDVVCPEHSGRPPEQSRVHVGLQVTKPTAATARGSTLVFHYVPEGSPRVRTFELAVDIVLCEGAVFDEDTHETFDECDYLGG